MHTPTHKIIKIHDKHIEQIFGWQLLGESSLQYSSSFAGMKKSISKAVSLSNIESIAWEKCYWFLTAL